MLDWQELFSSLTINHLPEDVWIGSRTSEDIWSQAKLEQFESFYNVKLPKGYKEYCSVFGSGVFGGYMRIYCPGDSVLWSTMIDLEESLKCYKNSTSDEEENQVLTYFQQNTLNCALPFGGTSYTQTVFWDLKTWDDTDESYDIYFTSYYTSCTPFKHFYKIGRSFYDFITRFCLGEQSFSLLPKLVHPSRSEIFPSFTRIPSEKTWDIGDTKSPFL